MHEIKRFFFSKLSNDISLVLTTVYMFHSWHIHWWNY